MSLLFFHPKDMVVISPSSHAFFSSFPLSLFLIWSSFYFQYFLFDFWLYINVIYTMISIQFIHSFNFTFFSFFDLFILRINPKFTKFRAFLLSIHIRLIESLIVLQIVLIVHIGFELAIRSLNWKTIRVRICKLETSVGF